MMISALPSSADANLASADNDRLIQVCTDKLQHNPRNVRALLIRAASYVKKGKYLMLTSEFLCMALV